MAAGDQIQNEGGARASSGDVAAMVDESDFSAQYSKSSMGRRNACIRKREQLNDFGRFKLFYVKGQFKKAVAKELMTLRAAQRKMPVKELIAQKRRRLNTHPVLRRVVGKFEKKLESRVVKKQRYRKRRLRRLKIKFRK